MMYLPLNIQEQTIIDISGRVGYSFMDAEGFYEGEGSMHDWNQMMWQVAAQCYPFHFGKIYLGAEFGYQHYLWYELRKNGNYPDENEGDFRLLLLMRGYIAGGFFGEFGLGLYDFENFGLQGSLGYDIKVSDVIYIPIKIRGDFTLDETYGNIFALGLNIGLALRFGGY